MGKSATEMTAGTNTNAAAIENGNTMSISLEDLKQKNAEIEKIVQDLTSVQRARRNKPLEEVVEILRTEKLLNEEHFMRGNDGTVSGEG